MPAVRPPGMDSPPLVLDGWVVGIATGSFPFCRLISAESQSILLSEKMKLRLRFPSYQLLFAIGLSWLTAFNAVAQEKIITKQGQTQDVKIVDVVGTNVRIQLPAGIIGQPLANIASVVMALPFLSLARIVSRRSLR